MLLKRREFVALLGGTMWPGSLGAQEPGHVSRVGLLAGLTETDPESVASIAAFRRNLQSLGWREGRNLKIDIRWVGGDFRNEAIYASELLALAPDVVVAHGTPAIAAFRSKQPTIPLVFVQIADPVRQGIVSNLPHPGGSMTGFMGFEFSIAGKWLQILKRAAPRVTRVAIMFDPNTAPYSASYIGAAEAAAGPMGIQILAMPMHTPEEIQSQMATLGPDGTSGLLVFPDTFTLGNRDLLVNSALQNNVPTICPFRFYAVSGGMISYGIDLPDLYFRTAGYVDRILKGEEPGDLPVQAPNKFQLVFNLKTLKALGLTPPTELLAQADEVIE